MADARSANAMAGKTSRHARGSAGRSASVLRRSEQKSADTPASGSACDSCATALLPDAWARPGASLISVAMTGETSSNNALRHADQAGLYHHLRNNARHFGSGSFRRTAFRGGCGILIVGG